MLLRAKSSVNCQNTKGDTPLLIACNKNHVDMARLLIHADADLVKANYNGDCALALAAWEGHTKIVQLLLSSKCNPDTPPDKRGDVPLLNASWQGHSEIVSLLVKAKASVTTVNKLKDCALIIAARNGYRTIVSSLVSHKADVERCNTLGDTPLILAAAHGDLGIVKALVAAGAAVDRRGSDGVTAMSKASGSHGNADVVKYLIKNGGNVNARSVIGRTPLMSLFAYYGELQRKEEDIRRMAEMLVHAGADVCSKDQFQRSILHHAAVNNMDNQNKYVSAAKMLLSAGASAIINDQDNKGKTAVMLAIEKGSVDMIAMLVECKADLTISRSDGMTSLMVAVQHDQHTELLQIIIDEVACAQ
jgi:ankyrin repeat protein